jgi:hypothetical protein
MSALSWSRGEAVPGRAGVPLGLQMAKRPGMLWLVWKHHAAQVEIKSMKQAKTEKPHKRWLPQPRVSDLYGSALLRQPSPRLSIALQWPFAAALLAPRRCCVVHVMFSLAVQLLGSPTPSTISPPCVCIASHPRCRARHLQGHAVVVVLAQHPFSPPQEPEISSPRARLYMPCVPRYLVCCRYVACSRTSDPGDRLCRPWFQLSAYAMAKGHPSRCPFPPRKEPP